MFFLYFVWRGPEESTCYLFCVTVLSFITISLWGVLGICHFKLPERLLRVTSLQNLFRQQILLCTVETVLIWLRWKLLKWNLKAQWRREALKLIQSFVSVAPPLEKRVFVHSCFCNVYTLCTHETMLTCICHNQPRGLKCSKVVVPFYGCFCIA